MPVLVDGIESREVEISCPKTLIGGWYDNVRVRARENGAGAALRMTLLLAIAAQAAYLSALFDYHVCIKAQPSLQCCSATNSSHEPH